MRYVRISLVLLGLLVLSPSAFAQGSLGVYADPNGMVHEIVPQVGVPFSIYVVLFTEDTANAVGYNLQIPGLGTDIAIVGATYGPTGAGLNIFSPGGYNVGLGLCANGSGGNPILVAKYDLLMTVDPVPARIVEIRPNPDNGDPVNPIYIDCAGNLHSVPRGPSLTIGSAAVPVREQSWGRVKAFYR